MYKVGDKVIALISPTGCNFYCEKFVGEVIQTNKYAVLIRWPNDSRIGIEQSWMRNAEVRLATAEEI